MEIYDKDGNFLGEFIGAEKEKIIETFDEGLWLLGIFFLIVSPFWTILVIVLWLIIKLIINLIKFALKVLWWIIKLPFFLIFYKEFPEFNKKDEYYKYM